MSAVRSSLCTRATHWSMSVVLTPRWSMASKVMTTSTTSWRLARCSADSENWAISPPRFSLRVRSRSVQ